MQAVFESQQNLTLNLKNNHEIAEALLEIPIISNITRWSFIYLIGSPAIKDIIKISEIYPKMRINFGVYYQCPSKAESWIDFKINSKELICIFNGKAWGIESFYNHFEVSWQPKFIPLDENEDVIALRTARFHACDLTFKREVKLDRISDEILTKLKEDTLSNEDLFIITYKNSVMLNPSVENAKEYLSYFKDYTFANIRYLSDDSNYKEQIAKINLLPKHYNYIITIFDLDETMLYDCFNLIDKEFQNLQFDIIEHEIKVTQWLESLHDDPSKAKFYVKGRFNYTRIVDFEQLKRMVWRRY